MFKGFPAFPAVSCAAPIYNPTAFAAAPAGLAATPTGFPAGTMLSQAGYSPMSFPIPQVNNQNIDKFLMTFK